MSKELITIRVKQVLGAFSSNKLLLAWNTYECHMTDSMRKDLKKMNLDNVIIPGGCIKYIKAFDVCWNNPFKVRMTELYDQWLNEGVNQFTECGKYEYPFQERNSWMGTWHMVSTLQGKHYKNVEVLWFEPCKWWYRGWLYPLFKKETSLQSWKTKAKLAAINFSWRKWWHKSIHFPLWWGECQWRNEFDWGWNRDYNEDF